MAIEFSYVAEIADLGMTMSIGRKTIALAALLAVPAVGSAVDQIVTEYPIASVVAGRSDAGAPVFEQMVAGLALPAPATTAEMNAFEACTRGALGNWGYTDTLVLDQAPSPAPFPVDAFPRVDTVIIDLAKEYDPADPATVLTPARVNAEKAARISRIDAWLRLQVPIVRSKVQAACGGTIPAPVLAKMRLLVSMRRCPVPVPTENRHPCNMIGLAGPSTVPVRERAYSQLLAWMQSQGTRPSNQWIDFSTSKAGVISPVSGALASASKSNWPAVSIDSRLQQFETQVEHLRKLPEDSAERLAGISASVPRVIGLTQQSASRVLDLLQSPMQAVEGLPSAVQTLSKISDEVARSRLLECVRLQGVDAGDLSGLGKCSGYSATLDDVASCLSGQRCMPAISAQGMAKVLRIVDSLSLAELAAQTQLPRVGDLEFAVWQQVARQCAIDNQGIPDPEDYQRLAMECTLNKSLGAKELATYNCVTAAAGDAEKLLGCLPPASADLQAAANCLKEYAGSATEGIWCAARTSLPPGLSSCISSYEADVTNRDALEQCLAAQLGNDASRLKDMMDCATAHPGSKARAALCMAAPELPKDLQGLAACGVSSSQSWSAFTSCAVREHLPLNVGGDLGKLAACSVQAGGDPLGTGVCMVDTGLNPTQQILLQCAATSGGEPMTFAVCSGGRLALKEFIQCKNVDFGEAQCFGKNNEIRRFVRALGLGDIGPNSVVGQIGNGYLDVIKVQVRYAEAVFQLASDAIGAGGKALEDLGRGLEDFEKKSEEVVRDFGRSVGKFAGKVRKKLKSACGNWC